jgi:hypothetical protein
MWPNGKPNALIFAFRDKTLNMARHSVVFATLYLLVFTFLPFTPIPKEYLFFMFSISPMVVIYMVYDVLRHMEPCPHTLEDRQYADQEMK